MSRTYRRWNPKQDQLLVTLAGTMPVSALVRRVNEVGPERTKTALLDRALRRGIDVRPTSTLLTTRELGHVRPEWTSREDDTIRETAGRLPVGEIVALLNERFLTNRTDSAVKNRAHKMGLTLNVRGRYITVIDVVKALRVTHGRVLDWIAQGILVAERPGGTQRGSPWLIEPEEMERFLRAHPHVVADWRFLPPGRWRDFLRMLTVRTPWLSVVEISQQYGVQDRVLHVWLATGLIPGAKRIGTAKSSRWLIPVSALPTIEAHVTAMQATQMGAAL